MTEWLNPVQQIEIKWSWVGVWGKAASFIKKKKTIPFCSRKSQKVSAQITRKCHCLWSSSPRALVLVQLHPTTPPTLLRHFAALLFKIDSWMSKMAAWLWTARFWHFIWLSVWQRVLQVWILVCWSVPGPAATLFNLMRFVQSHMFFLPRLSISCLNIVVGFGVWNKNSAIIRRQMENTLK